MVVISLSPPLPCLQSNTPPQKWAAALQPDVIRRLVYEDPSLQAFRGTKVNDKLSLTVSLPPLLLSFFPLHLNQKFLISLFPLGRDLVYVRALRLG